MKNIFKKITPFLLLVIPIFSFAADPVEPVNCGNVATDNLSGILTWATCILAKQILPILITLGVAGFIYGVIRFYLAPSNEKEKEKAKGFITKGLIALFVMVSFWGIINLFVKSLNLNNNSPIYPTLPLVE